MKRELAQNRSVCVSPRTSTNDRRATRKGKADKQKKRAEQNRAEEARKPRNLKLEEQKTKKATAEPARGEAGVHQEKELETPQAERE